MSDKRGKMEELANQKCVACDRGAPKADDELINKFSTVRGKYCDYLNTLCVRSPC